MITKKLVTLLSIYVLSSTAIMQAMDEKKLDLFFSNYNNSSMKIKSVVNKHEKYTQFFVDNVNGGITNWHGKQMVMGTSTKSTGISLNGVNNLGKIIAFIQINNTGETLLLEPYLEIKNIIEDLETGTSFQFVPSAHKSKPILNVNGNEIWEKACIKYDRQLLNTTGFQQLEIRFNHAS